jgi:transcriptional regulator with XRE-family HTH domain
MAPHNSLRAFHSEPPLDFDQVAAELVRALRGKRSQAAFSRRLGYKSSVVHRWETQKAWPAASRLLACCERLGTDVGNAYAQFFQRRPAWLDEHPPATPQGIAAFLRQLRGKTPILRIAEATGINRFSLSRWLQGRSEPNLPDFLCVIEACSRRMVDFVAGLVEPTRLPAIAERWHRLEHMRRVAYEFPLSHGVLRALELAPESREGTAGDVWLEQVLGMTREQIEDSLRLLESTGQIRKRRGIWRPERIMAVNTGTDPERARDARLAWTQVALERMTCRDPGHYGYSLFAIGREDLRKLRDLHVEYLRAMQDIIATSKRNECVALYCSQLIDLRTGPANALAPHAVEHFGRTSKW